METSTDLNKVLNDEAQRLECLCTKWQNVLEAPLHHIAEDVRDQIRTVIGQTKLLLKEKLQQFRDLLKNYETGRGDVPVTQNDLEGFWDLVSLQVNDVNEKFCELETRNLKSKRNKN